MRIIGNDPNTPRQTQVVASGTLSTGDTIVINADGTVSAVAETSISEAVGTGVSFDSTLPGENCVVYDSNAQKVVITYRDTLDSNRGHAVVGTVTPSDNSISFGTPVQFTTRNIEFSSATYDSANNKVVVAYADSQGSRYGYAIVGDVSGTSISFGSETVFNSYEVQEVAIGYDANAEKVVIVYEDWGNSNVGTAIVGTVSGTSISFGTEVTFDSNRSREMSVTYDSNAQKIVIAYKHDSDNSGEAIVGTVSGTSISFGSSTGFDSNNVNSIFATYDSSSQKVVIAYRDVTNNSYGEAIVGTVSGTSISFGTSAVFNSGISTFISATYDANVGKVVIAYRDNSNSFYGTVVSGTVSGTSISFDTEIVFDAISTNHTGAAYDANSKKVVIASADTSGSGDGVGTVYQASGSSQNLTAENYIGTAKSGATDGDSVVVNTQGTVSDIPETYYDIANASYDSVSFSVTSQENSPQAFAFSADGTKMYVGGSQNNTVYQYTLSTAWDLSTASYASKSFSFSGQETGAQDIAFKTDGTKMFITGTSSDAVNEYALSTAWDVSSASFTVAFSVSSQDVSPQGVTFNPNGTQMYVTGNVSNAIFEYTLSTAWDVSSASYASKSLSVGTEEGEPRGVEFNSNGTKVFITGSANDSVFQYNLTTAYDISTGSYANVSFAISEDGESRGPKFKSDGSKMYILGFTNDSVFQYTTLSNLTAGQSYYVQTDGTLSTTAGDPSVFAGTAVSATKLIVKG